VRVIGFADHGHGPARDCTGAWLRWENPLALTNETATELFKLSPQPQFYLNLNRCAVHTSWNNGDLIKQTHRERRLGVLPIFSGRAAICLTRRALHIQLWPVDNLVMFIWPSSDAR